MVSQWGVKANPNKIWVILEMNPPRNIKEVQSLNGRVATLNRFVSWATNKCFPFFRIIKKAFEWIDECERAFEELKAYLASPPLLSLSKSNEELSLYLVVSPTAISLALIWEEDHVCNSLYTTLAKHLGGTEERYPPMEKLAFAFIIATRKLKPYFQAHIIVVQTDKPLWKTMDNSKAAWWLVLWAIELSEFDIRYRPRTVIKTQALANYIVKFTTGETDD